MLLFPWNLLPAHSCEYFLSFLLPGDGAMMSFLCKRACVNPLVIYLWCFCVYVVCVCMKYTGVLARLSVRVFGGGQRLSLVSFFIALHLIFESNLSLNSELTILTRLAGQWIPGTHLSLCPQGWGYETIPQHTWLLWVCKRSKLTFLCLHRMHFPFWDISSFVNPRLGSTYSCTNLVFTPKQVFLWEDVRAHEKEFDVIQPAGKSSLCLKTSQDYIHSRSTCTHCCVGLKGEP